MNSSAALFAISTADRPEVFVGGSTWFKGDGGGLTVEEEWREAGGSGGIRDGGIVSWVSELVLE